MPEPLGRARSEIGHDPHLGHKHQDSLHVPGQQESDEHRRSALGLSGISERQFRDPPKAPTVCWCSLHTSDCCQWIGADMSCVDHCTTSCALVLGIFKTSKSRLKLTFLLSLPYPSPEVHIITQPPLPPLLQKHHPKSTRKPRPKLRPKFPLLIQNRHQGMRSIKIEKWMFNLMISPCRDLSLRLQQYIQPPPLDL